MSKRADSTPPSTNRTRVRRLSERGAYDRPAIDAILDEALVCHVGFVCEGQPYVIPTIHVRHEDRIIIHGSPASRMLRMLVGGAAACITVTLLDGLVLARSAFHHSMNYRSVVILGRAHEVTDPDEKRTAFRALVEHVIPGGGATPESRVRAKRPAPPCSPSASMNARPRCAPVRPSMTRRTTGCPSGPAYCLWS